MDGNRRERPPRANTGNPSFYPPAHVAIQGFHHHHHLPKFCLTICISYFPDSEKQNIQLSESRRNSIRLSCGFGRALWGAPLTSHNHTDSLLTWEMEDTKHRGVFRCHFFWVCCFHWTEAIWPWRWCRWVCCSGTGCFQTVRQCPCWEPLHLLQIRNLWARAYVRSTPDRVKSYMWNFFWFKYVLVTQILFE